MSRIVANPAGKPRGPMAVPVEVTPGPVTIPPPPAEFNNMQLDLWHTVWTAGRGVYSPKVHSEVIIRYVELADRRQTFLRILDTEGWLSTGAQGQTVLHPIARQLDAVEARMLSLEDRLGLSPESSLRLGLATVEVKSKLEAFKESMA